MSRQTSHDNANNAGNLAIIKKEQRSPSPSTANLASKSNNSKSNVGGSNTIVVDSPKNLEEEERCKDCDCKVEIRYLKPEKEEIDPAEIRKMMTDREHELREEFEMRLEKEMKALKERFDFILQNEQVRTSYMLREAHRERQEKIMALQTQLQCKNLAGLMYVMCSERNKCKLEKAKIIEDFTNFINILQDILGESQELILNLSRGFKTATRVDHEWRQKMKKLIYEFQCFVTHFGGGTPEENQYFFDLPALLHTEALIKDNPDEDPCECYEEPPEIILADLDENKTWWDKLDGDYRPFVMFGDMSEFKPPQRREVLRNVKASKTAPKKWKEYVFNEMLLKSGCPNLKDIKDEYFKNLPEPARWECHAVQTSLDKTPSDTDPYRRVTTTSVDYRGNMGSLLKIITSTAVQLQQPTQQSKATLLGARDSMELTSTTRLRGRHAHTSKSGPNKVVLNVKGGRRTSFFDTDLDSDNLSCCEIDESIEKSSARFAQSKIEEDESVQLGQLGNVTDSLSVLHSHVPDVDHKINYEKICPMEKCQRMNMNSFVRSLPPYMQANPFTHFQQTYEQYEACSPEQLEMLQKRINDKNKKDRRFLDNYEENPLHEWTPSVDGIGVQTSEMSLLLPPCTCRDPNPSPVSSVGGVFRLLDLIPVKQRLDRITRECFYDEQIEFDRFKVLGQESEANIYTRMAQVRPQQDFTSTRLQEIRKILKQHPSLCDIFQANTQC